MKSETCIVGLVDEETGDIYMGGDAVTTFNGWSQEVNTPGKIWGGDTIYGGTGNVRPIRVARYAFQRPARKQGEDLLTYMNTRFIRKLFSTMDTNKCLKNNDGIRSINAAFLVGLEGTLFQVGVEGSVMSFARPYTSIGSGYPFALGSLASTQDKDPTERVLLALQATAEYDAYVKDPFLIKVLRAETQQVETILDTSEE